MTATTGSAPVAGGRVPPADVVVARVVRYLPALVVFVAVLVLWELYTGGEGRRVIPPPSSIWAAAVKNASTRYSAACTGLRAVMTRSAAISRMAAKM